MVSILDRVYSRWCPFGMVSIWDGVHSGWSIFGIVYNRDRVQSGRCPCGVVPFESCIIRIVSIWDRVLSGSYPFGIVSIWDDIHRVQDPSDGHSLAVFGTVSLTLNFSHPLSVSLIRYLVSGIFHDLEGVLKMLFSLSRVSIVMAQLDSTLCCIV